MASCRQSISLFVCVVCVFVFVSYRYDIFEEEDTLHTKNRDRLAKRMGEVC